MFLFSSIEKEKMFFFLLEDITSHKHRHKHIRRLCACEDGPDISINNANVAIVSSEDELA